MQLRCIFYLSYALLLLHICIIATLLIQVAGSDSCSGYETGSPTCPPDCGSSEVSGRWVAEVGEGGGQGEGGPTLVEDLLYRNLSSNVSTIIANIRCERDEYMPIDCRTKLGVDFNI